MRDFAAAPAALELGEGGIAECFRELALPLVDVVEVYERGSGAAMPHPRHKFPEVAPAAAARRFPLWRRSWKCNPDRPVLRGAGIHTRR